MAALGTLTGRVLIQIGDEQPIEIGTVEIPVQVKSVHRTKGHEHVTLDIANDHTTTLRDDVTTAILRFADRTQNAPR